MKTLETSFTGISSVNSSEKMDDTHCHSDTSSVYLDSKVNSETSNGSDDIDSIIENLYSESGSNYGENSLAPISSASYSFPDYIFETDPSSGLSNEEVLKRRKIYGVNQLSEDSESHFKKFLKFFIGPIQHVMELAAILAAGLQDWIDFAVILLLLLMNAVIGFYQEYQAGSVVEQLKKTIANVSYVIRDGEKCEIAATEVVPGDIVQIEDGSVIPADGRLVSENCMLKIDQSSITGESLAVQKRQGDEVYSSSTVKTGSSLMIVTAIGDYTFVGKAASLVSKATQSSGHFTEVLNGIGTILLVLVVLTLVSVWTASFYRGIPLKEILRYSLGITVIGVPVGLPAVVTTTMAVGAAFLAKKQAIVQKLSAIESLAGVEILCSDKTGTLTKNKLSLHEPFTVSGINTDDLMLTACLAASRKKCGLDAIDKAFLKALTQYPNVKKALGTYKVLEFYPFDPVSKKVTAVVVSPEGKKITCIKGAPLFVLKTVQQEHPIDPEIHDAFEAKVASLAACGYRSLGVARKFENEPWEILGIMPLMDPPRDDTLETIKNAKQLGLRVKMLTGDAVGIAKETSRQLGLGTNIYNAETLGLGESSDMPGSELADFVESADGFAEVFPQHKYRVVEILQNRGYLVAMTGDGVNDAPSLKRADTGIAVEGSTDAARCAADIIFLAPGLSAIIDALKTSRQIFHRMYAYVIYRIALSIHLEIFLGLWIIILNQSLNINLIVIIAIFSDIATMAVAYDNAPYSQNPVKWNLPRLWGISIVLGTLLGIGTWITLTTMYVSNGGIIQQFGSIDGVLFLQISLTENWLIFITRAVGPFWSSLPSLQLASAIFIVDIIATCFTAFGLFTNGKTDIVTIISVYIWSLGVFCILGGCYYLMAESVSFDRVMHGKSLKPKKASRTVEDFLAAMQKLSYQHENSI